MITLKQFFEVSNYRISEGSDYGWDCFGPNAYTLDAWNGVHGTGGWSISIVFDTNNQTVYDVSVCDYKTDNAYQLINPNFIEKYNEESKKRGYSTHFAYDEVKFIELTVDADWLEKAYAIVNSKPYDNRIKVEINLSDDELLQCMKYAHELDITFNEFVNQILQNFINKKEEVR